MKKIKKERGRAKRSWRKKKKGVKKKEKKEPTRDH